MSLAKEKAEKEIMEGKQIISWGPLEEGLLQARVNHERFAPKSNRGKGLSQKLSLKSSMENTNQ